MTLDKYIQWFESHERILIIALVLGIGYFGFSKYVDKSALDASNKAAVAIEVAAVQHDADQKIAAAVAQQTALFNQIQLQHEQEIASLVAAVASRDAASNKKIVDVNQPKTPSQAVVDLQTNYALPVPVVVTTDGADVPVADLQLFTTTKIDDLACRADLMDTQKELSISAADNAQAKGLISSLQNQVSGLQSENAKDAAAAKAELASAKADARKGKFAWFKRGFVVGYISGLITAHYTGI